MVKKFFCILLFLLSIQSFSYGSAQTSPREGDNLITAKIIDKEHVVRYIEDDDDFDDQTKISYYLIFTDKEVFKIEDSLIFGQFKSSDVYGMLEIGKTYKFKVFGLRIPLLSTYRNIIGVYNTDNSVIKAPTSGNDKSSYIVKVLDKEYVDGLYLIYTNEGTFKIDDSLIFGRFNSSDVYGMMKKGKYYRIKTFGVRSGLLSTYKNIIEVEPLD